MKAELKQKWIDALRSGEYQQGRTYFERSERYCCLGVLCKIADEPTMLGEATDNWRFVEGSINQPGIIGDLIYMNDGGWDRNSKTFPEIADYIEANIPADEHSVAEVSD